MLEKGDEIIITESKQWTGSNSVSLSGPGSGVPAQMTDDWVTFVIENLESQGKADLANKIDTVRGAGKLTKVVTVIDRTTSSNVDGLIGGITIVKVN